VVAAKFEGLHNSDPFALYSRQTPQKALLWYRMDVLTGVGQWADSLHETRTLFHEVVAPGVSRDIYRAVGTRKVDQKYRE
jgi:hypothetical protein